MKKNLILGAAALVATGVAGFAAGMKTVQMPSEPTEEHKWLASLAGEFTGKVSSQMLGDSENITRTESALGGMWNLTHYEGTMMGQPYKGMEIMGYDPLEKEFVSVWVDSMNPLLTILKGTYDEASKTLTMSGPSRGMDGMVAEMMTKSEFNDRGQMFTMHIADMPFMTIDYTRTKGAAREATSSR